MDSLFRQSRRFALARAGRALLIDLQLAAGFMLKVKSKLRTRTRKSVSGQAIRACLTHGLIVKAEQTVCSPQSRAGCSLQLNAMPAEGGKSTTDRCIGFKSSFDISV